MECIFKTSTQVENPFEVLLLILEIHVTWIIPLQENVEDQNKIKVFLKEKKFFKGFIHLFVFLLIIESNQIPERGANFLFCRCIHSVITSWLPALEYKLFGRI